MTRIAALSAVALALLLPRGAAAQSPTDAAEQAFRDDVHATAGLTCESCHAPRPGTAAYGAPPRTAVAPMCARCHSDAAYMRQFAPQVRIDQFSQYLTSAHGRHMTGGETRVATCSDCHGSHGVRRPSDPRSPVAPGNVTETCARCHGDGALMTSFGRSAMPPDDWRASVHAAALVTRGDTSAPTCSSCHGSHGATPPGVTDVANVCAQCHVRQAELFRASPKREIFDGLGQAECLACHDNHRIESPADDWIGVTDGTVCGRCHDDTMAGAQTIFTMREELDRLSADLTAADEVLARAERAGMLVDDGRLALREARQHQIQSRVLVHTFAAAPFSEVSSQGVAAAARARAAGDNALDELSTRRRGLAVATLVILAFLFALGLKIRRLPAAPSR